MQITLERRNTVESNECQQPSCYESEDRQATGGCQFYSQNQVPSIILVKITIFYSYLPHIIALFGKLLPNLLK
jgi:hypothetical protein